jgi:hypothetical protein
LHRASRQFGLERDDRKADIQPKAGSDPKRTSLQRRSAKLDACNYLDEVYSGFDMTLGSRAMTTSNVRSTLIGIIFFGYIVIMLSAIAVWLFNGFDFDEFTTTIAVILPLLSSHVATVVTFTQKPPQEQVLNDDQKLTGLNAAIAITPPTLLITLIFAAILLKGLNLISIDFPQFKIFLTVINSMFGAYVATLVSVYIKREVKAP